MVFLARRHSVERVCPLGFFFSSRRRHTRFSRDWSSDVCSSDLDLARATRAERINILAPIPGKDTVGIELANSRKVTVTLRELLHSPDWDEAKGRAKIPLALGKDVYGKAIVTDLAQMPHLLVAGTT